MAEAPGESYDTEYDQQDLESDAEENESLREHIKEFQERDAILEPGILRTFEDFLDLGGEGRSAVKHLSSSYTGLPMMVNTLLDWLHAAGCKKKEIQALIEDHLKLLILKHFDPKKADLIFTEEGSTPSWLEEMISFPTWRELLYKLADQYPECLMLKFTIKLISDAGYHGEITSVSTASHQPEVFCERIKTLLSQVITSSQADIQENFNVFCQLVCHSQHTYFYSQALIDTLGEKHKQQSHFTHWLREKLQKEARKRKLDVTSMTLHFNGVGNHSRVFEALGSMLSRNALNPADVTILYRCYTDEDRVPTVKFLWNVQFLELLVQMLFKPGSPVNPEHKDKYLFLLAYAASVYETTDEYGGVCVVTEELSATREAIETAYNICCSAYDSQSELLTKIATLLECIRYPVVSMGVLYWVEATLTGAAFFGESAESSSLFLVLLDEVATYHTLQHSFVHDLISRLLEASYPMLEEHVQLELKRSLVDHLIHLFSCGHVIPVINYIIKCSYSGILDHSLIRHFILEVLSIIQPPYSQEFTAAFQPLLNNEEITAPIISSDRDDLISIFLAECPKRSKKKKRGKK